jgi:hypothetical protein
MIFSCRSTNGAKCFIFQAKPEVSWHTLVVIDGPEQGPFEEGGCLSPRDAVWRSLRLVPVLIDSNGEDLYLHV